MAHAMHCKHRVGSKALVAGRGRANVASRRSVLLPPPGSAPPVAAPVTTPVDSVADAPFAVGWRAEQGLREGMEDELQVAWDGQQGMLFAACMDGHGGPAAAQWLSQHLQPGIMSGLKGKLHTQTTEQLSQGLTQAFHRVDTQLLSHLEELGGEQLEQAGATATVLLLWPDRVVAANVGDSQAYLWRKGQVVPLTTPHRVYGTGPEVEGEVDRVKATGGWVYDGRVCNVLAVSRAFGDWEFKGRGLARLLTAGVERGYWATSFAEGVTFTSDPVIVDPSTCDTPITPEDEFLVLSTDGLWDVMPPREALQWARKELQKGLTPHQVAESLVQIALKRHTTDNTSVVVVDLKGKGHWAKGGKQGAGAGGGLGGLFGGFFGGR